MDDELIEKVARAICDAECIDPKEHEKDYGYGGEVYYPRVNGKMIPMIDIKRDAARAAIQAVREWDTARSVVETSLSESLKKMWRAELASIGSKLE